MVAVVKEREVRSSARGKQLNSNHIDEIPKLRKASQISHSEFKLIILKNFASEKAREGQAPPCKGVLV